MIRRARAMSCSPTGTTRTSARVLPGPQVHAGDQDLRDLHGPLGFDGSGLGKEGGMPSETIR